MSTYNESDHARDASGKYAPKATSETDVAVLDDPRAARAEALASDGYAPAMATGTRIPAVTTEGIERWWGQQFANAEYGHASGDRLAMPDDYTPNMTGGRALSGHRRTHRMRYEATEGVTLRMPSKTSIRRFSADHHNRTFDVPVSATIDGRNVTGYVRVTKGSDGMWDARGLGFPNKDDELRIAESVSMTLEGQRRPVGISNAGAVSEHRAARMRAGNGNNSVVANPIKSSWIETAGWQDDQDGNGGMMVMSTKPYHRKGGGVSPSRSYGFKIDKATYGEFISSERPGQTFNAKIKGNNERVEVTKCGQCGMFTTTPHNGNCPSTRQTPRAEGESNRSMMREAARMLTSGLRRRT